MRVEDVVDGKSLNAYLDGLSQDEQRDARLRVVFRPAARIFPIASRDLLKPSMPWPQEAIAISGFVKISISGLALKTSNPDIAADVVTLADKRSGSALSTMGRSYDYDVANTALLAARALFQGADCAAELGDPWEEIRADLRGASGAIWSYGIPSEIEKIWSSAKDAMMGNGYDWSFWIAWYERVLHGRDWCADEVGAVVSKIKEKDFDQGPLHINPMFDEVLALYRAEDEARSSQEISVSKGKPDDIARTKAAMIQHRKELPPAFDSILGYISLEIGRLQGINQNRDEVDHQISVLLTIYEAVERLHELVPKTDIMKEEDAVEAEGIVRLVFTRIREWPRTKPGEFKDNVADLVDNSYRAAMIGGFVYAAPMLAVSAETALIAGAALFGGKKIVDSAKAAKGLIGGEK